MQYRAEPYRWVILLSVFPVLAVTQMFWLTFSAVSPEAAAYYHTSSLRIACLSMSYMVVYILLAIPAARLADRRGLRASFFAGAALTAVCGLTRGIFAQSYVPVVLSQVGMAAAQPFLVNPITRLAAVWFPVDERATASGVASIAGYAGIIAAEVATPALYQAYGMAGMLRILGATAVAAALPVFLLLREAPRVPAGPRDADDGFSFRRSPALRENKNFLRLLFVVFIALGVFNALLTCLSDILLPRGVSVDRSGIVGGAIIVAGLLGAVAIPMLSDRLHRRSIFLSVSMAVSLAGTAGLCYLRSYPALLAAGALAGFFLMGAGPLIFQFGTEVAYPVPEGTSYGLLMGSGQVSGIAFIVLLYALRGRGGSMTLPLSLLMGLMAAALAVSLRVTESKLIRREKAAPAAKPASAPAVGDG